LLQKTARSAGDKKSRLLFRRLVPTIGLTGSGPRCSGIRRIEKSPADAPFNPFESFL